MKSKALRVEESKARRKRKTRPMKEQQTYGAFGEYHKRKNKNDLVKRNTTEDYKKKEEKTRVGEEVRFVKKENKLRHFESRWLKLREREKNTLYEEITSRTNIRITGIISLNIQRKNQLKTDLVDIGKKKVDS